MVLKSEIKPGDKLVADDGFDCLKENETVEISTDEKGNLFVPCSEGRHYVRKVNQLDGELYGFSRAPQS